MVTAVNRVAVFAFIAFASSFVDCSIRAQSQSRVVVLVGKNASALAKRVLGQTADLDWSLKVDASVELSNPRNAIAVGQRLGADVVVWFDISSENRVLVNAVEIATSKDFKRPVALEGDQTELSASATVEAAALVVRSLLIALDRNREVEGGSQATSGSTPTTHSSSSPGVDRSQPSTAEPSLLDASSAVPQSNETTRPADSSAWESSTEGSANNAYEWQLAIGWTFVVDGVSPAGQYGPHLRLGLHPGHLQLALMGYLTLPVEIESDELTLELKRYGLLAAIGYEFFPESEFRLSTSVAAGILLFIRSTRVHIDALTPTPDATIKALAVRWDTRVQWFPQWVERIVGLEFFADLAVIPASVDFGIREDEVVGTRKESWVVQPSFGVSFVLRID